MKILLIRPRPHPDTIGLQSIMITEPLELEYLAGAVQGRHQVVLADMILEKKTVGCLIDEHRPQVVGITAYIAHVNVVREYAREIKKKDPRITVVIGGVHADVVPEDFLDPAVDYIISGDGIAAFQRLIHWLDQGSPGQRWEKIIRSRRDAGMPDTFPDRTLSQKYRHLYYYLYHNPCALLKTSYGCPFSCRFCFCRQITGEKYAERDLDQVMEELKQISEPEIYIVDDNFLVSRSRVERFCSLLKEQGIKKQFLIYGRADFIAANADTMARFKAQGLRAVIVGVESPNPGELAAYDKKSSVQINEAAIAVLNRLGIDCYATLILGIDWDENDFHRLYHWLKKQKLRFINLQPLTPLPGTPLFDEFEGRLLVPRERYQEWDLANLVIKPEKISLRRYYWHILSIYFRITLRPESLSRNLKYGFRANLKLSLGAARITWQYLKKILKG